MIPKSKIQSIIFNKNIFTLKEAKSWLKRHNYIYSKVDITSHYYRFRQIEPNIFKKYKTITFTPGIEAVIGFYD